MLTANSVKDKAEKPFDRIFLSYENRFKRRLRMETEKGHEFLLNLPKAIELPIGGALMLENGQEIEIKALKENLLPPLTTLATLFTATTRSSSSGFVVVFLL